MCANAPEYGSHAQIAPEARVDDGWLNLILLAARSPLALVRDLRHLVTDGIHRVPGVRQQPFREAEIGAMTPLRFHVDGEAALGPARLVARVHPGALRVRVATPPPQLIPPSHGRRAALRRRGPRPSSLPVRRSAPS